jgi:hypothetical protein
MGPGGGRGIGQGSRRDTTPRRPRSQGAEPDERVTWDQVQERFRERARSAHPDAGGSDLEMARLSESKGFAKQELVT